MNKQVNISLAAFQRRNGKWAIATRVGPGDRPKIFSAKYARAIAYVLRGHELNHNQAPSPPEKIVNFYVSWFKDNFVESLIPKIADQLENLAALVDRENAINKPWMIRGEVINDGGKDKPKLH